MSQPPPNSPTTTGATPDTTAVSAVSAAPATEPAPVPVLAHELSARYLQPLLDLAQQRAGDAALEAFLFRHGARLSELRDHTNWVSLRFCETLVDWLATVIPEQELVAAVTDAAVSPRAMGFLYPFFRAFGSPARIYASVPGFNRVMNRVSAVRVFNNRPGSAEVEYRPEQPQFLEHSPLICALRRAQFASVPALWGLPKARVEELECQARGGQRCHYVLRWTSRMGGLAPWLGLAVGGGLGVALGAGFSAVAWALLGAALGLLRDGRAQSAELVRFNDEQARGLREAAAEGERRFVELLEAKAQVDARVDERTRELQAAGFQLQEAVAQLRDASRVKDEFLANVSHELRTPLTLILAPLDQLLAGTGLTNENRDLLTAMRRSASRLYALVNDLLELSRMEAGQLRLDVSQQDVNALVATAAERFRPLAVRRNCKLDVVQAPEAVTAWMDPGRMDVVLDNLLSNAMKFTPPGGQVVVAVAATPSHVSIQVKDSGPGIDPALQARVFERFERFDVKGVGGAGTGIGLALVKGVVEMHGGTTTLMSRPGQGTTFEITLRRDREHFDQDSLERRRMDVPVPFGRRVMDAAPPRVDAPAAETGPWNTSPQPPRDAPRVLVVEDHEDLRAFLVHVLSPRFVVTTAPDGVVGLELARSLHPDAVVTDLGMPRMDGRTMTALLREDPATRAIPVIMLTAQRGVDHVLDGLEVAQDYVTKPFVPAELLARVDVHVRLRRLTAERVHHEKLIQLGTLAAGLAHEVNNPASALLAILPRLRRNLPPDTPQRTLEAVATCVECAQRIVLLVQDLLTLGRPDRDGPVTWDVREGLESTVRLLQHRCPPGVTITTHLQPVEPVMARPPALNQVFLNLLDNALRAVGAQGTITVSTQSRDGGVSITIQDSGPGIPAQDLERIFDPFFTTRQPGEGTGLGLHITQGVVREHGGTIRVDSVAGQGAVFTIWLPRALPKPAALEQAGAGP